MANKKISSLTSLGGTPDVADIIPITDVSDTTGSAQGTTKKVTVANLVAAAPQGDLQASNNLSDLGSDASARTNLGLGTAATSASTDFATATQGATADSAVQPTDSIDVLADVDTSTVSPTTNDFLNWDGSNWVPAVPTADVNTPLTTALRGTDNPHIGAFPNQSLKVIDNPSGSVLVVTDSDGNLDFVVKTDASRAYLNTPSGRLELTTGVSVVEDSTEPDIEITTTSGTYSLITGDSDELGANGLPIRQGFNVSDIGANQAPLLISGGTIS